MPWEETENEIRHRERDPDDFESDSFRRITLKKDKPRVFAIVGRLKGETTTTIQALRFPKEDGWTMEKAKAWYKDHYKKDMPLETEEEPEVEYRNFRLEVKATDDATGEFTGVASVCGVEDLGGDLIEAGAFSKTVAENPIVKVLWQHDPSEVIGQGKLQELGAMLTIKGQLDMDDPQARKVYGKLKKGLISGLSIGFQALKVIWEETKERYLRHITELKVWEVSIVTFPMLPQAQVTSIKRLAENRMAQAWAEALREIKEGRVLSRSNAGKLRAIAEQIMALLAEHGYGADGGTSSDEGEAAEGKGAAAQAVEPAQDHSTEEYRRYHAEVMRSLKP